MRQSSWVIRNDYIVFCQPSHAVRGGCKGAIIEMLSAINMEEASPNAIVNTFGIFLLIIKYLKSFLFQVGSRTAG